MVVLLILTGRLSKKIRIDDIIIVKKVDIRRDYLIESKVPDITRSSACMEIMRCCRHKSQSAHYLVVRQSTDLFRKGSTLIITHDFINDQKNTLGQERLLA